MTRARVQGGGSLRQPLQAAAPAPRAVRTVVVLGVAALLGVFVVQATVAARRDSAPVDEFVHLPLGLHALLTHDLSQDPDMIRKARL